MDDYKSLIQKNREKRASRDAKYKVDSKARLKTITKKKIKTTMIGALDSIETHLGFLWDEQEGSDELRELYEVVRQEILDRGNHQMRNLDSELDQYDIEWLRYSLKLPVRRRNQDNDNQQD
jgi:hypothetical protein